MLRLQLLVVRGPLGSLMGVSIRPGKPADMYNVVLPDTGTTGTLSLRTFP